VSEIKTFTSPTGFESELGETHIYQLLGKVNSSYTNTSSRAGYGYGKKHDGESNIYFILAQKSRRKFHKYRRVSLKFSIFLETTYKALSYDAMCC
jgi:hypothetical protein